MQCKPDSKAQKLTLTAALEIGTSCKRPSDLGSFFYRIRHFGRRKLPADRSRCTEVWSYLVHSRTQRRRMVLQATLSTLRLLTSHT